MTFSVLMQQGWPFINISELARNVKSLLHCPFTPFIILFCHTICTSSLDDLTRLKEFLDSLETAKASFKSIEKLHQLCNVFYRVARLYLNSLEPGKGETLADDSVRCGRIDEGISAPQMLNPYLANLGIICSAPSDTIATTAIAYDQIMADNWNDTAQAVPSTVSDWYARNLQMMGILESDFADVEYPQVPLSRV
ncbi:uncharacterized protein ATNIH1004_007438 [Aspergillus tanneri]|uniref:Uncharacterized protein n=1 Tax=Aspergillus tanneri TaxID=1220188 RepID=A0A5M9MJF8_9EURO|nr:uncharacterized protein ATNIH1004_007438 [Aspergillus tanneri]KAA8646016.1 hypothetical protein ATNIH1004_007438 [Aspergillus tanneri]